VKRSASSADAAHRLAEQDPDTDSDSATSALMSAIRPWRLA
jgi:hypothetical protein